MERLARFEVTLATRTEAVGHSLLFLNKKKEVFGRFLFFESPLRKRTP